MQRERRMTGAILMICVTSLLCSCTMFAMYDLRAIIKPGGEGFGIETPGYIVLLCVVMCQYSINVFIYAARCEPFRKAYLDTMSSVNPFPAISQSGLARQLTRQFTRKGSVSTGTSN